MNDGGNCLVKMVDLGKSYHQTRTIALRGVNASIAHGEFVSVWGASGSGKTTLLNLLAGLIEPTEGAICFEDRPLSAIRNKSRFRLNNIGYIFQDFYLYPRFTVMENILLPFAHRWVVGRAKKERALQLLDSMNMGGKAHRQIMGLSTGERQRVCIARALLNEPLLVLADEPTGNLDSVTSRHILEILKEMNESKKTTIIVATHDQQVDSYATRSLRIADGSIVAA